MLKENMLENEREQSAEEYSSKVSLKFFRHDKKSKTEPGQPDQEVALTQEGKTYAKSLAEIDDASQAVAFGSPFRRAKETSALVMAGKNKEITGNETLEELKEIIDKELKVGTKIGENENLGFDIDENSAYGKEAYNAFRESKWLKFLVEESDHLAEKNGDKNSSTYSRQARNIAKVIEKYAKVANRFDQLVAEKPEIYENELKRFFGSHQGVLESFLAKMIYKTKGKAELDKFVEVLENQGFGFTEGFEIDIETRNNKPVIKISYKHDGKTPEESFEFEEIIDLNLLQEIIEEGKK